MEHGEPQRVEVRLWKRGQARKDFRSSERQRRARRTGSAAWLERTDAEINQHRPLTVWLDDDVRRFHIVVHDAAVMHEPKRAQQAAEHTGRGGNVKRRERLEGRPLDESHDEGHAAVAQRKGVTQHGQRRVVQIPEQPCLSHHQIGVGDIARDLDARPRAKRLMTPFVGARKCPLPQRANEVIGPRAQR